jgi:hypothetical protein
MSDIVIKTENLGKKYVIGYQAEKGNYTLLRDVLMQNARTRWGSPLSPACSILHAAD